MAANTYGRQVVEALTNKSGGQVIAGDVVVISTGNDSAFTTDTAGAFTGMIGIAQETIANNAVGRVLLSGQAALVNVNASVTRGNFGKSHTVAKQATDAGASRVVGVFCQFLTGGAAPSAHVFGITDASTGAGGAPSGSLYIVGALDGTLSAEKVRADLYKNYHPDNYPTSGTDASTDEFDDSSLNADWTWTTAPGGTVSETQFPGFLHIDGGTDASNTARYLRRAFVPGAATAYSVACKLALGISNGNFDHRMGIVALDSSDVVIGQAMYLGDGTVTASDGYRLAYGTGPTVWATTVVPLSQSWIYLLFTRDASDVYNYYWSGNGIAWTFMGTATNAATVAKVGILYGSDTDAVGEEAIIDFVRVFDTVTRKIGA